MVMGWRKSVQAYLNFNRSVSSVSLQREGKIPASTFKIVFHKDYVR